MCSGCPVLPEKGNRGDFSCRKCRVLREATVSSSESEGFASSDSFPHFWEPGHSSPAISWLAHVLVQWGMFQGSGDSSFQLRCSGTRWQAAEKEAQSRGLLNTGTLLPACTTGAIHIPETMQIHKGRSVEVSGRDKYRICLFFKYSAVK